MHGPYLSTCGYIRCVRGMRDGSTLGLSGRLLGGAMPVRRSMEIVWWWIAKFCAPQLCFSKFAHCSETLGCSVCFSFGARWFRSFWATSTLVWVQPFNTEQADEMRQEHGLETGEYTFKGSTDWQHRTDRICTFPVLARPRSKATNSPAADGMGA